VFENLSKLHAPNLFALVSVIVEFLGILSAHNPIMPRHYSGAFLGRWLINGVSAL
jgi:hypothetical protein